MIVYLNLALALAMLLVLGVIAYEDFKHRAVSWLLLLVIFVLACMHGIANRALVEILRYFSINVSFVLLQLCLLTIYFSVKNRTLVNISKEHIGWGDILFFLILCVFFAPLNFIVFYIGSLCLVLTAFIVYKQINRSADKKVPLAGGMALIMLFALAGNMLLKGFDFYDDSALLVYFMI